MNEVASRSCCPNNVGGKVENWRTDWVSVFQVLAVGDLHPADIRYSYTISRHNVKSDFDWSNKVGPLSECNRACQGT